MIIIGTAGKQNAGKDALVDYLQDRHGFRKLSTGDIIRNLAEREGVPRTRKKLQDVASELISRRGEHYLAGLLIRRIEERDWDRVGIPGLRTPADVRTLKDRFPDAFTLVHVKTEDPDLRFRRGKDRGESRDTDSYEEFIENDRSEEELFDLKRTLNMAEIIIQNDGSMEDFHRQIEEKVVDPLINGT